MFENDDWIFEDTFDIDEGTIQAHSRCQNEEEEKASSVKRRKMNNCKVLFSPTDNILNSDMNIATEDSNSSRNNKSNVSRGDLLLGIFRENTSQEIYNLGKEIINPLNDIQKETQDLLLCKANMHYKKSKEKNRTESVNTVKLDKEVKLVRIFPGPAGLVPDVKNNNIPVKSCSHLNKVKELENKTAIKRIEIKSQDEKKLFGEKAWKFLFNDVSDDFFEEYRISIIKKKANANHCTSMKVRFLAGILDYIDHSHDDPFIILKDSTGSIEGTIHRDILLKYPGILEPNVVILLHDVGLLKTTTYVITNKYHILISQINLLAIYSDKGRIVSASHMENILSNIELNRDYSMSVSKQYVSRLQGIYENCDKMLSQTNFSINNKSIKNCEATSVNDSILHESDTENCKDKIFENSNYSISMNNLGTNNIFLTSDCEFITLKEQNCLNSENISHNNKIPQCELQARNVNHLENVRKESIINSQNKIREEHLSQSLQKCVADVKIFNAHYSRESCLSSYDDIVHEAHKNSNLKLNIKPTLPGIKRNSDNSRILVSYFTDANEYDSDDEILSQLDVDNVCSDSKKKC